MKFWQKFMILGAVIGVITLHPIFWMLALNLGYGLLEEISIEFTQGAYKGIGQFVLMPILNILIYGAIFALLGWIIGKLIKK